ncbi:MAG: PLP-dependent lyase/thiolase [Thermoleophilia bacterium]|nr:PLP-dependent lyase/thiolase [Thermoleophilia bacterium]
MPDRSFAAVLARRDEIVAAALGIDYGAFERGELAFEYEALMASAGTTLEDVRAIQRAAKVGSTPLLELPALTRLARLGAPAGKGATILVKDEAANPSGSFKARRASVAVHEAARRGYRGVVAATSGNYGAAVASQAAMRGLDCIVLQEVYDSLGRGQPEILEKGRACEAYGAEVWQLTVGPELFYAMLLALEETGYFSASLYTPHAIAGIETLGHEIGAEVLERYGRPPDAVVCTNAGGGNVTGTARGLRAAGCGATAVIGVSVDLRGLRMDSDRDFNRKSFTTGHTGFAMPFLLDPDRTDVPRSAARPLRYLDRHVTVTQGEVFYVTEALARLEGLERGPAGNTSLAAAIPLARELDEDAVLVVQETEYTGAGKHPTAQLTFARELGVEVRRGHPSENVPGRVIAIPRSPGELSAVEVDLDEIRRGYLGRAVGDRPLDSLGDVDLEYLAAEVGGLPVATVAGWLEAESREAGARA